MTVCSAVFLLAALLSACFGGASRSPDQDYKNFLTAASRASSDGYTMYWLGRSFSAGGLTFEGPGVPDFGGEEAGGGVAMSYSAQGGAAGLNIGVLSAAAWGRRAEAPVPGSKAKTVMVLGRPAELQSAPAGTRPVNALTLIMSLGDTHVVAVAHAIGPVTPGGPDANPLIDEATFLSVLEQLRPYPQ